MHWRRLPLDDIPLSDPEMFNTWLLEQWQLKDKLIEHYALNGRFPADDDIGFVETAVGLKSLWEIGHVFLATTIIAVLSVIVRIFHGHCRRFWIISLDVASVTTSLPWPFPAFPPPFAGHSRRYSILSNHLNHLKTLANRSETHLDRRFVEPPPLGERLGRPLGAGFRCLGGRAGRGFAGRWAGRVALSWLCGRAGWLFCVCAGRAGRAFAAQWAFSCFF